MDTIGRACFVIKGFDSRLMAANGSHLFGLSIMGAKLLTAWAGIVYTRLNLRADQLVIENDSSTIIGWIRSYTKGATIHPLQ